MYQGYDGTQQLIRDLEYYINTRDVGNSVWCAQELSTKLVVLHISVIGFEQETIPRFSPSLPTPHLPIAVYPPNGGNFGMNPLQNPRGIQDKGYSRSLGNPIAPPRNPMGPPKQHDSPYMASPGNPMALQRRLMPGGNTAAPSDYPISPGNPMARNPLDQESRFSTNHTGAHYDPTILVHSSANRGVLEPTFGVDSYVGVGQATHGSSNQPRQPVNPQLNPSNNTEKQSWINWLVNANYTQSDAAIIVESCNSWDEVTRKLNGN